MKKTGLGRGLDALLNTDIIEESSSSPIAHSSEVNIDLIDVNKEQARKVFDENGLNDLCESIKLHGIIQPLILTERAGRYTIVAGERRYRAARMAGLRSVPAVVRSVEEERLLELSLIENIQREDLSAIDEARAITLLMEQHGYSQETVSERIGRSRSAVANILRLLGLPASVQQLVNSGSLSAGHARALLPLGDADLIEKVSVNIIEQGLSVRASEDLVKKMLEPVHEKPSTVKPEKNAETIDAERILSASLETRVQINGGPSKGKVIIEYYSAEQLDSLFSKLK